MRILTIAFFCILVAGCTQTRHRDGDAAAFNLQGQPISRLIEAYGPPQTIIPIAENEKGYIWRASSSEIVDTFNYMPKEVRAKEYRAGSLGEHGIAFLTGDSRDTFITRRCKFDVFTRDGIVTKMSMSDFDTQAACSDFYEKWQAYQSGITPAAPKR